MKNKSKIAVYYRTNIKENISTNPKGRFLNDYLNSKTKISEKDRYSQKFNKKPLFYFNSK